MKTQLSSALSLLPFARAFRLVAAGALLLPGFPAAAGTVAWWRFEAGPAGAYVTHGGLPAGVFYPGVGDSSGNGNALSVWAEGSGG
jgi:hypothetical protein